MPNLIAGLLTSIATVLIWRRLSVRGAFPLFLVTSGASIWAICESLLFMNFDMTTKILITKAQYIGVVAVPPGMIYYSFAYIGSDRLSNYRYGVFLAAVPVMTLFLAWTNEYHHLIWIRFWTDDSGIFPMLANSHGSMFWFWIVFSYLLLTISALAIIKTYVKSNIFFKRQLGVILAAMAFPWCGNVIYNFGLSPIPNMDLTAIAFTFTGLALAWGFFRYKLYDVIPIARDEVFRGLKDGVIVLDADGRLVDYNPAALTVFDFQMTGDLIGRKATEVFQRYETLCKYIDGRIQKDLEVSVESGGIEKIHELKMNFFSDKKGNHMGNILVFRDITARKQLESELQRLAETDPLTGIRNMRCILEYGKEDFRKSKRYGRSMSVLMLDVDHFKRINDTYGHQAGDAVLKEVARTCRESMREPDVIGRFGGEEFLVVLPETGIKAALSAAERLRRKIEEIETPSKDGVITVTVSIGVSQVIESDAVLDNVIKRADEALYIAKTRGRNNVAALESDSVACRI